MKVFKAGIFGTLLVMLAGCSVLGADGKRIDYGAAAAQARTLDIPPDLSTPGTDERYKMPQSDGATATSYSDYSKGGASLRSGAVLPLVAGVTLERNGVQRWLKINDKPENVWPVVKAFWIENGLTIKSSEPAAGLMETDWVENRAKFAEADRQTIMDDILDDKVYSEGERDQYRTRLERGKDGKSTEVYITHRGMEEVFSNDKKVSKWQARGSDSEKEAIMLQRLMVRFGSSEADAASAVSTTTAVSVPDASSNIVEPAGTAILREVSAGNVVIVMSDPFDRAWRKVGLAIGSSGLEVEDRNRDKGVYYLRPVKLEKSWWERLKFWKSSADDEKNYLVNVKDGGAVCEVSVIDQDGASSNVTRQMIETIYKNINQ